MAKLRDLIAAAEEAVEAKNREHDIEEDVAFQLVLDSEFEVSDPRFFPAIPQDANEELRMEMRAMALQSHFYMAKVILGYEKLRIEPHGPMCAFLDFLEDHPEMNRSIMYHPRDTFKTTVATITRAIRRGCADPNSRGLILADTSKNAVRFGTEVKNHFQFNERLKWLFPEVIPENFNAVRWNNSELVLKRSAPWREPTFDMMGAGGGIESRHYDWIIADDLVTEKHIRSDLEMDGLIHWIGGLEPLLVNDVEGRIDFVGSRKKKGDAYEHVEKYYGAKDAAPVELGPHAVKKGALCIYSRGIIENGKVIFPYVKELKSGISMDYIIRIRTHDPERYHAQLANDPKGSGLNWFDVKDLRFFTLDEETGVIEAVHEGEVVERCLLSDMQIVVLYDPAVSEKDTSSKNALHVVAKGSSPRRYVLESQVGHFEPAEMIGILYKMLFKWNPEVFSIEKRGFQGWVKHTLDLISALQKLPYIPVIDYPMQGSPRSQWSKKEVIRSLQPVIKSNLLWINKGDPGQQDLISDIEFYPNVRWDDSLDALAQGTEIWPYSIDEAELAASREQESNYLFTVTGVAHPLLLGKGDEREPFDELKFLSQIDASGYGIRPEFLEVARPSALPKSFND